MKKQICVNVDVEYWIAAKQKIPNISEYLSECLKGIAGKTDTELKEDVIKRNIEEIQNTMQELSIKKSILEMDLKLHQERLVEEKRIIQERQQYQRWKCPVCKNDNFMENDRCSKCQLPTKKDPKTTIIYLDKAVTL